MRSDLERLDDVLAAASGITSHLARGPLADGLIFDAVRAWLIEISDAVKDIDPELLGNEPDISWKDVARMKDHLTHRYFDTDHAIVGATVEHALPPSWTRLAASARWSRRTSSSQAEASIQWRQPLFGQLVEAPVYRLPTAE